MKKKIFTLLTMLIFGLSLCACANSTNGSHKGNPVVPTYQGMTISKNSSNEARQSAKSASSGLKRLSVSASSGDTDDHDGHDDDIENDIEDLVTIDVETDDQVKYYVMPSETFIVEVHISNPYQYEIQSFTLNGKKYANYMFESGSTMELLLLETTAPSTPGYIDYTIDAIKYIDGTEIKDVDMSSGNKSIKAGITYPTSPSAQVSNVDISTTSFEAEINVRDSYNIINGNKLSIYLTDGNNVLASKDLQIGNNKVKFDNLVMSTTYQYGVVAVYDLVDGRDLHEEWLLKDSFSTLGAYAFKNITKTQDSISFEIEKTGNTGNITSISIYDFNSNKLIESSKTLITEFDGLLSNHSYIIYVDFSYSSNGATINDWASTGEVKTTQNQIPSLSISSIDVTDCSIKGSYTFVDSDDVGTVDSISLYKGETFISECDVSSVEFENLDAYSDYKIVINYSYDLRDGNGLHSDKKEYSYKTSPRLGFNSCRIINTSAVSEGETIYMQVSLDNPSGAIPESVVVNGQKYNCASSTSQNKIYVEIINNGQFEGGNTELTIQKVNMKLDGKIYSVEPKNNNSDSVFINGILSVESLELVNSNNEIVYYAFPKDEMKLLLTLKNKTGYSIDGTSLGEWIKIDDNHYYKNVTLKNGWNYYDLTSISYSNDSLSKTLNIGYCSSNRVYKVNSNSIVEINSLSGLQNTTFNGGYYKLTSDIDLSKTEWTNLGSFYGILDGNGYSIKNMTNVSTVTDKDINIGLFKDASGLFLNCKLEDVTIMMTLNSTTPDEYFASFGGFVSGAYFSDDIYASFINCEVTGDISINNTTSDKTYVGGLVGYEYPYPTYLYIDNCRTNININIKKGNITSGVGAGLVGYFAWASCKIFVYNSYVEGSINASSAQVINGTTPWSPDIVDYKNNRCNVLLNGVKTTSISDLYIYGD